MTTNYPACLLDSSPNGTLRHLHEYRLFDCYITVSLDSQDGMNYLAKGRSFSQGIFSPSQDFGFRPSAIKVTMSPGQRNS